MGLEGLEIENSKNKYQTPHKPKIKELCFLFHPQLPSIYN